MALPGGDQAAYQPWRNLLAQAQAFIPEWQCYPELQAVLRQQWQSLARAIERGINTPRASSAGRLFDAIAAALGLICQAQSYEGEAACRLEALARQTMEVAHPVIMPVVDNTLDMAAFWHSWLNWSATPAQKAWGFHDALAAGLAALVQTRQDHNTHPILVCSGGVMHNRLLRSRLQHHLTGITLWFPHKLPAGDGGISFGQTLVAAARYLNQA